MVFSFFGAKLGAPAFSTIFEKGRRTDLWQGKAITSFSKNSALVESAQIPSKKLCNFSLAFQNYCAIIQVIVQTEWAPKATQESVAKPVKEYR